jgi:putative membrane protein
LAVAIGLTAWLLPGMDVDGGLLVLLGIALVFSLVNVVVGTLLKLLTAPLTVLTLGLFAIVVNAVLLALTAWLLDRLSVDNALTAVVATLLISLFSTVLSLVVLRRSTGQVALAA